MCRTNNLARDKLHLIIDDSMRLQPWNGGSGHEWVVLGR
jgi:hypothetical protein